MNDSGFDYSCTDVHYEYEGNTYTIRFFTSGKDVDFEVWMGGIVIHTGTIKSAFASQRSAMAAIESAKKAGLI